MQMSWPSFKTLRRIAIGLVVALVLVLVVFRLFAMTPMARDLVEARLEALEIRGQSVEIDRLEGDLLGTIRIGELRFRDQDGLWLTASELKTSWSPLALLGGGLRIREIEADEIAALRRPVLAPARKRDSKADPFIKSYRVDSLGIESLKLAEGLAGPEQAYSLSGALEAGRASGQLEALLSPRSPESGDQADIRLAWGGKVPIQGEAHLKGVPGGLISALLRTEDGASVELDLQAEGRPGDWSFSGSGLIGDKAFFDAEARIVKDELTLEGWADLESLGVLEDLKRRFGTRVDFSGGIGLTDKARPLRLSARSAALTAELEAVYVTEAGQQNLKDMTLRLSDLDAPRLTGSAQFDLSELELNGDLTRRDSAWQFDGRMRAPRLHYASRQVEALQGEGRYGYSDRQISVETAFVAGSVSGLPDQVQKLLTGQQAGAINAKLDLREREAQLADFRLSGDRNQVSGRGSIALSGASDLQGRVTATGLPFMKRASGRWSLSGERFDRLAIAFSGEVAPNLGNTIAQELVGDQANVDLGLRLAGSQDLRFERVSLSGERFAWNASGALRAGQLEISGQGRTTTDTRIGTASVAPLSARFEIAGPVASPVITYEAGSRQVRALSNTIDDFESTGTLSLGDNMTFAIESAGALRGQPAQTQFAGRIAAGELSLETLSLSWAELAGTGTASIPLAEPHRAELSFEMAGSAPLLGELNGALSYQEERLDARAALAEIQFAFGKISRAQLDLGGMWPVFSGQAELAGQFTIMDRTTPVALIPDLMLDAKARHITLSGGGNIGESDIRTLDDISLSFTEGLSLSGSLEAFGGRVDVILPPAPTEPATLQLADIQMAEIGPIFSRPSLRGTMDGEVSLAMVERALSGKANVSLKRLARGGSDAPEADLVLQATAENGLVQAALTATDEFGSLNLVGTAETQLTSADTLFSTRYERGTPLKLSLSGEGTIAPLWSLAAPPDLRIEGLLDVDLDNGDGSAMRFVGPLKFFEGEFEDGFTGLHLNVIKLDTMLGIEGIELLEANANGANGGELDATGTYRFDGTSTVDLTLKRLDALGRKDVRAVVSGKAALRRANRRTNISGDLFLDRAEIDLSKLPQSGYVTLDVSFNGNGVHANGTSPPREAIALDLGVKADRRIFVRGPEIDTEWALDARVRGSPGAPRLSGQATLVRGEADLLSRRFRFDEGSVRFVGAPQDSILTLSATRSGGGVTSTISLSGSVLSPEISLSADPPLPEDEIISRVLFGRSPAELSPLQAAQLAGAAAQLAGGDAFNLMTPLQAAVGLDRLDLGFDENGGATLSTGKYIAEDVYLEIETGVSGAPGVSLEWTPLSNVEVDADIDPERGPKVAVQWKRDFDRLPGEGSSEDEE